MATITTERVDLYPNTTKVKAYLRDSFHRGAVNEGKPGVEQGTEGTMTSGKCEITGLVAGTVYILWAEVAGKDTYLLAQCPVAASTNPVTGAWTPAANKLLGATYDPVMASVSQIMVTAGTLQGGRVYVPEACKVSKIIMWMTVKGATLTALENGLGIFEEGTRKLIGNVKISTLITAWEGAVGEVALALESAVNIPAGYVSVAGYFKGTTAPTFAAAPVDAVSLSEGLSNVNVATTSSRYFTADAGLTTALPATMGTPAVNAKPWWIGLA